MFQKINQIWVRVFLNCIGIKFYLLYLNDNVAYILYRMVRNDPLLLEAFTLGMVRPLPVGARPITGGGKLWKHRCVLS